MALRAGAMGRCGTASGGHVFGIKRHRTRAPPASLSLKYGGGDAAGVGGRAPLAPLRSVTAQNARAHRIIGGNLIVRVIVAIDDEVPRLAQQLVAIAREMAQLHL